MKVAYITTVYNVNKYLEECLSSLEAIKTNKEVWIVDDLGSEDPFPIVENFLKRNNDFHYIKNEKNLGIGFARNEATKKMSDDITHVYFIDSDDKVDAKRVDEEFHKLKNGISRIKSGYFEWTKNGYDEKNKFFYEVDLKKNGHFDQFPYAVWGTFWAREVIVNVPFSSRFMEDQPWIIDNFDIISKSFEYCTKVNYFYRLRKSSTMNKKVTYHFLNDTARMLDKKSKFNFKNKSWVLKTELDNFWKFYWRLDRESRKMVIFNKQNKTMHKMKRLAMLNIFFAKLFKLDSRNVERYKDGYFE